MQSCIKAARVWCSPRGAGMLFCSLPGCSVEEEAAVVQKSPLILHHAFVGTFPLLLEACTSAAATAMDHKENRWQKPVFS